VLCLEMDSEDPSNTNPRRIKEKAMQVIQESISHETLWEADQHLTQESPTFASTLREHQQLCPWGAELIPPTLGRYFGTSPEVRV